MPIAHKMPLLLVFAVLATASSDGPDPREIVRKSAEADQTNWEKAKDYTYVEREQERHGGKTSAKTYEITTLYGHEFRRLTARDDRPLSGDDAAKEQKKWDKEIEARANESAEKRAKREAQAEKDRQKERAFVREIPEAFDFTLEGEESIDGRSCWMISATPRAGFQPKDSRAKALSKVRGKVWIGKQDSAWVKAEIEIISPLRWGLFVASLSPGTAIDFVQMRVNNELWMPKRVAVKLDARLLFKKFEGDYESTFSGYRKFSTESKIISGPEAAEQ